MSKPDSKSSRRNTVSELILASILLGLLILTAMQYSEDSEARGAAPVALSSASEIASYPAGMPAR